MISFDTTEDVTHEWTPVEVSGVEAPVPVLLAAMETFRGTDTANVRIKSLHQRDFPVTLTIPGLGEIEVPNLLPDLYLKIEEEQSANVETKHTEEVVGHVAFDPGRIEDFDGNEIGYAGLLEVDQPDGDTWRPLPIPTSFDVDDSVAFAQVLSFNGSQPVHPRLATAHPETGEPGFHFKLEEWPTYDQRHVGEKLGYVVMREGRHAPGLGEDPHVEAGTVSSVDHVDGEDPWHTVELDNLSGSGAPVVVTGCQTYNGSDPVVTRQTMPENDQFDVRLQEAESGGFHPAAETVGYLAIGVPLY